MDDIISESVKGTVSDDAAPTSDAALEDAFSAALADAGFTEKKDPVLEDLGIDHEGELEFNEPGEDEASDEPEGGVESADEGDDDPLASLTPIERIDYRDAFDTLRTAGFSMEQLQEMSPSTAIRVADSLRARQASSQGVSAMKEASPASPEPKDPPFDLEEVLAPLKEEYGAKGASAIGEAFKKLMGHVEQSNAQAVQRVSQETELHRILNEQRQRIEGANPDLKARPHVWDRVVETAKVLAGTGLHGTDPTQIFDVAAKTFDLATSGDAKPKATSKDIMRSQPNKKVSVPSQPKMSADDWDFRLLTMRMNKPHIDHGQAIEALTKKVGPRPAS